MKKECWILPRPRPDHYKGGFPLHFEKKLLSYLGLSTEHLILHPFGGMAEYGIRVDIKPDVKPDIIADAHNLPFRDNIFDLVLCDPPYSDEYSKKLYGTGSIRYGEYSKEAARVCRFGGFLAIYHKVWKPKPSNDLSYFAVIVVLVRFNHAPRVVSIFQKQPKLTDFG